MANEYGLLDDPWLNAGIGLLSASINQPRPVNLGQALMGGVQGWSGAQDRQRKLRKEAAEAERLNLEQEKSQIVLQQLKQQIAEKEALEKFYKNMPSFMQSPAQQALAHGGGPTPENALAMQGLQPKFDQMGMYQHLMTAPDAGTRLKAMEGMAGLMAPKKNVQVVGNTLVDLNTGKPVFTAPPDPNKMSRKDELEMMSQLRKDEREFAARLAAGNRSTALGGLTGNIEKPMTEAQQLKLRTTMKGHRDAIGQVSQEAGFLKQEVERLMKHPGLSGMTGVMGYFKSAPTTPFTSGNAKAAENILEGIKGRTMSLGRAIQSQSGKLGNMAVQEWKFVSDALAALDPKSSDFPNQLKNLTAQIDGLESRMKESYETTYEPYFEREGFQQYRLGNIPFGGKGSKGAAISGGGWSATVVK